MGLNAEVDASVVHSQNLAKGAGFAHQHTAALAQE